MAKIRRKRLNVTRRQGRLYFRRETYRLHDGTPDGETLWVYNSRSKPRDVVYIQRWTGPGHPGCVVLHLGTYRIVSPVEAARMAREHLTQRYRVVRKYRNTWPDEEIETGLCLHEARAHCNDPETSSRTARSREAQKRTRERGEWFDCYEAE